MAPSCIEINLSCLKNNIEIIKKRLGKTLFCLPVKSNAYGHGIVEIAKVAQSSNVDYLAVARLEEGILLRKSRITMPILVFGSFFKQQIKDFINFNLEFTLSSKLQVKWVSEIASKLQKKAKIHVKIETGLQRIGVDKSCAKDFIKSVLSSPNLELIGIYSHFASSNYPNDSFTLKQIDDFKKIKDSICLNIIWHLANTGGVVNYPSSFFDMARPALLTYGYCNVEFPKDLKDIKPCLRLKSKIFYLKKVEKNLPIGYSQSFITTKKTSIAIVPIGYGDGYCRSFSNKSHVLIKGKRYPVVGNISMDQLMVDVGNDKIDLNDEVILIGKQKKNEIAVKELAGLCDFNLREVMVYLNSRLKRKYIID